MCIMENCSGKPVGRGLCASHYYKAKRVGSLDELVPRATTCERCGGSLQHRQYYGARFCSPECKEAARTAANTAAVIVRRTGRVCVECQESIPVTMSSKAITCSRGCAVRYQNRRKSEARAVNRDARPPCPSCGEPVPSDRRWGARYCSPECKKREMDRRSRERAPHYMREYLYGITAGQYAAMLAKQGDACAICRSDQWDTRSNSPHVDHDHKTGAVRGLLCQHCNNGLGRFKDDPALLRVAADYLER